MITEEEKQLKKLFSNAEKEEIPIILNQWMDDTDWGTEVEAFKLVQFIKVWDQFNIKMKSRDKRTAMVNANISHRILAHFTGLAKKGSTLKLHSLELLSYGIYGPDGMPKSQAKNERLNNQIVHDALALLRDEGVESIRSASRRLASDRTTVRANRRDERYAQSIEKTTSVLKKINEKHDF